VLEFPCHKVDVGEHIQSAEKKKEVLEHRCSSIRLSTSIKIAQTTSRTGHVVLTNLRTHPAQPVRSIYLARKHTRQLIIFRTLYVLRLCRNFSTISLVLVTFPNVACAIAMPIGVGRRPLQVL
jgi:hypothetical protein